MNTLADPWYDPEKSYEENYDTGPGRSLTGLSVGTVGGLPFGIPAGPLLNAAYVVAALKAGFDYSVYKTVRSRAFASHPWPNVAPVLVHGDLHQGAVLSVASVFQEPISITNSFGVPSMSPDVWQPDMERAQRHAKPGQRVIGSCQGTRWPGSSDEDYVRDWATVARLVCNTRVLHIETNLSCPNEGHGALVCFDTDLSVKIIDAVKSAIGDVALTIKISYFATGLEQFMRAVGPLVEGVSCINTIPAQVVNGKGEQALPGPKRLTSGICGASIRWAGLDMVRRLALIRAELGLSFEICGVGGVMAPEDYSEYRMAGADVVMSATGAMWRPTLAEEIRSLV